MSSLSTFIVNLHFNTLSALCSTVSELGQQRSLEKIENGWDGRFTHQRSSPWSCIWSNEILLVNDVTANQNAATITTMCVGAEGPLGLCKEWQQKQQWQPLQRWHQPIAPWISCHHPMEQLPSPQRVTAHWRWDLTISVSFMVEQRGLLPSWRSVVRVRAKRGPLNHPKVVPSSI
jgi:hypothetical protein